MWQYTLFSKHNLGNIQIFFCHAFFVYYVVFLCLRWYISFSYITFLLSFLAFCLSLRLFVSLCVGNFICLLLVYGHYIVLAVTYTKVKIVSRLPYETGRSNHPTPYYPSAIKPKKVTYSTPKKPAPSSPHSSGNQTEDLNVPVLTVIWNMILFLNGNSVSIDVGVKVI